VRIRGNITYTANGMEVPTAVNISIETNIELEPPSK
jgi:hypothetical protein